MTATTFTLPDDTIPTTHEAHPVTTPPMSLGDLHHTYNHVTRTLGMSLVRWLRHGDYASYGVFLPTPGTQSALLSPKEHTVRLTPGGSYYVPEWSSEYREVHAA